MELYEQVAGTTDETKKYYTMYNTLQNTKEFIVKESKVMDRWAILPPAGSLFPLLFTFVPAFAKISPKIPTRGSSWKVWKAF